MRTMGSSRGRGGHSHLLALILASSMLARATTRMILAAQSAYASGRTGVAFAGQTIMITLGLPVACEAPMFCRVRGRLDSYSAASKRRAGSGQWRRKTWMAPRSVRTTWELLAGWAVRNCRPRRRRSQPILPRSNSSRSTRPASISSPAAMSGDEFVALVGRRLRTRNRRCSGALNTDAVAARATSRG